MKKLHSKLHFRRFEAKYVVTKDVAAALKKVLLPYLKPDPHAGKNNEYEIRSVYYDSPRFYYYHQKIDGVGARKKIRMRTYRTNGKLMDFVFLEIKRKYGDVITKDRFNFSREEYDKFLKEENFRDIVLAGDHNAKAISDEFEFERGIRGLSPKVLVTYIREPYHGLFDKDLRITFDRNIRASENDNLFYTGNDFLEIAPYNKPGILSDDLTVVELKFRRGLPFYVAEAIRTFDLERTAFSKYCMSIDACGTLHRLKSPQWSSLGANSIINL